MLQTPGRRRTPQSETAAELAELVRAAVAGDEVALGGLVDRFDRVLRGVAGSYRLSSWDVDDVVQATWLELVRDIERLREPAAIAAWLATATRRKAMRLARSRGREDLTDDAQLSDGPDDDGPEASVIARERGAALACAVATLPSRHRRLITLLLSKPALDYQQISDRLAMPVGSIGPIRARSLTRLSLHPELRALR
jgi:RNA polymerase sigma factor (sigma-70 family)